MKRIIFNRHNIDWMATCYLDGNGVCEITIEKKRVKKRWYQRAYEYFLVFYCVPGSVEELETSIYRMLDKKFSEVCAEMNFKKEFQDMEDVSYFESKSS